MSPRTPEEALEFCREEYRKAKENNNGFMMDIWKRTGIIIKEKLANEPFNIMKDLLK